MACTGGLNKVKAYLVLIHIVMVCAVLACVVFACIAIEYIPMADIGMALVVLTYIVLGFILIAELQRSPQLWLMILFCLFSSGRYTCRLYTYCASSTFWQILFLANPIFGKSYFFWQILFLANHISGNLSTDCAARGVRFI